MHALRLGSHDEEEDDKNEYLKYSAADRQFTVAAPTFDRIGSMSIRAETIEAITHMRRRKQAVPKRPSPFVTSPRSPRTEVPSGSKKRESQSLERSESTKRPKVTMSFSAQEDLRTIDLLYDQYVVRGGFGGRVLGKQDFISCLPRSVAELCGGSKVKLKDVEQAVKIKEGVQYQGQMLGTVLSSTDRERKVTGEEPPLGDMEFLKWAANEIGAYTVGPAMRLRALAATLSNPRTMRANLAGALDILQLHVSRLRDHLQDYQRLHDGLKKGGPRLLCAGNHLELGRIELQAHYDRFRLRVEALKAVPR